jgi:hypothetical protein
MGLETEMAAKTERSPSWPTQITDNRCVLEFPFARHDYSPTIQISLQLINISKRRADTRSSSVCPSSCNSVSTRRWEGASCSGSLCSSVRVWPYKYYEHIVSLPPNMSILPQQGSNF